MKLLANENFPLASVQWLNGKGIDIVAVAQVAPGDSDFKVLSRAVSEKRIVVTFDRDYGELIYRLNLPTPPGIVYLRFVPRTPLEPAEYLIELINAGNIALEGKFTVGEEKQIRQRPLPNAQIQN